MDSTTFLLRSPRTEMASYESMGQNSKQIFYFQAFVVSGLSRHSFSEGGSAAESNHSNFLKNSTEPNTQSSYKFFYIRTNRPCKRCNDCAACILLLMIKCFFDMRDDGAHQFQIADHDYSFLRIKLLHSHFDFIV